jgi:hypothetical protein
MFLLLFSLLTLFSESLSADLNLLEKPQPSQIHSCASEKGLSVYFSGSSSKKDSNWSLKFEHSNKKTSFLITAISDLPKKLTAIEKSKFHSSKEIFNGEEKDIYRFSFGNPDLSLSTAIFQNKAEELGKPLKKTNKEVEKSKELSVTELTSLVREKHIFIYVGQNSGSSSIISTADAAEALSLDPSDKNLTLSAIKAVLKNPEACTNSINNLFLKTLSSKPTSYLWNLRSLALRKQCSIITDSKDFVLNKMGIECPGLCCDLLNDPIFEKSLKSTTAIVTIGVDSDIKGLLGLYKTKNKSGVIVAINENRPNYIGNKDFFVEGEPKKVIEKLLGFL